MAADLTPVINEMTEDETVMDGATTFINSVPGLMQAAVSAAVSNGATADQLQPVSDLATALAAKRAALLAALTANTPAPAP